MGKKQKIKWIQMACAWFAGCDKAATGFTPHPILGAVPTCDSCHKFATGEERQFPAETFKKVVPA